MERKRVETSITILFFAGILLLNFTAGVHAEESSTRGGFDEAVMVEAVMCEAIENFKAAQPAAAFSIALGEVFCFSNFDPVFEKTYIFHKWYKKDKLIFTMRLTLSPPKWSSFSRIQIRDADKGPWRVEIRSLNNTLLKTLRFSMVD